MDVGNLSSVRGFIGVEDVVQIYWHLVQTTAAYGEIVNIGSGQGIVMGDLLSQLIDISGLTIEVKIDPERYKPIDIPAHYSNIDKLKMLMGTIPTTALSVILKTILTAEIS